MKYKIHRNLHTDFNVFEDKKLPERSYFIPFSSEKAFENTDYKNERYNSDRVTILSGAWDFVYYKKLSEIPTILDTQTTAFDKINVPCTWQRTGYDQIAYINTRYPFPKKPPYIPSDVAVGIYRKFVEIKNAQKKRILTFLGVAGALAIYINGKYAGYSEGSHNTAEFDITSLLQNGKNEILAVVYKWSNGTYLECQDMFRENGVFRDVYITVLEDNYINDFLLRSKLNPDGTYDLIININGNFSNDTKVEIQADNLFNTVLEGTYEIEIKSLSVQEWTAETPSLYEVHILLKKSENLVEAIRTYIGFKNTRIDGNVFLFNSKPIKLLGVNHHDTHMTKGYAMSIDDMELDVKLMKKFNCNAVRTSHYPPDPVFLTMCDFYGLYVIDEADIETHGFYAVPYTTYNPNRLSNDIKWAAHYLDRVKRMYGRDKNHPCITMWSLGNESGGYKCQDECYNYLKQVDPDIPVHYEGATRSRRWAYDVVSRMYATPSLMRKILKGTAGKKYKNKPFFQCEYAHAMGNGPGGLEEYMQLFYSSNQFMGGCIWEWADHSVYDENAKYKWTYGGDHNESIHDGNFCVDGLFYPDRKPSSGAYEMKTCYRPLRAKHMKNNVFLIKNTRYFKDSSDIKISFEIIFNGSNVQKGNIDSAIAPGQSKKVQINSQYLCEANEDVFVNFIYSDKENEEIVATEQIVISIKKQTSHSFAEKTADIVSLGKQITVSYKNGQAVFDKSKGLVSYIKNNTEYLNQNPIDMQTGFVPHIYRGRIDNDQYMVIFWNILGLGNAIPKLISCSVKSANNVKYVSTTYDFVTRGIFILARSEVNYYFDDCGKIKLNISLHKICPFTAQLPRFGVHAELKKEFEKIKYYGKGPLENYSDFSEHAPIGIYNTTVTNMAHKYIKPQDAGNRGDVRFAVIANDKGAGIKITALDKYINFNANHFTLEQLKKARHIEDLPDCNTTYFTVDGYVRGTGSGSCGPLPSKEHLIHFDYCKPLNYSFEIEPFNIREE